MSILQNGMTVYFVLFVLGFCFLLFVVGGGAYISVCLFLCIVFIFCAFHLFSFVCVLRCLSSFIFVVCVFVFLPLLFVVVGVVVVGGSGDGDGGGDGRGGVGYVNTTDGSWWWCR